MSLTHSEEGRPGSSSKYEKVSALPDASWTSKLSSWSILRQGRAKSLQLEPFRHQCVYAAPNWSAHMSEDQPQRYRIETQASYVERKGGRPMLTVRLTGRGLAEKEIEVDISDIEDNEND
jgi:hypothetical protein